MSITSNNLIATKGIVDGSAWTINADYANELLDIRSFSNTSNPANTTVSNDISFWYALYQLKTNWGFITGSSQANTIWSYLEQFKCLRGPIEAVGTIPGTDSIKQTDPYWMGDRYYTATSDFTANYTGTDKSRRIIWLLNHFAAEVGQSEHTYVGLKFFKDKQWEDIGLDITGSLDVANGGLVQLLLTGGSVERNELKELVANLRTGETLEDVVSRRIDVLSQGLRNLGTLFDVADLANMGKAKTLIENLYQLGLSKIGNLHNKLLELQIESLDDINDSYLRGILQEIKGLALEEIIERTGVVLPNRSLVTTAADLLEARNIFSRSVQSELPGGTIQGLAQFLDKIPGQYNTFEDVIQLLNSIEVPDISNLVDDVQPLPSADYDSLVASLPLGSGIFDNPVITDFFEPLTGSRTHAGFKIFNELNRRLYDVVGGATMFTLYSPANNDTWRNAWVTTLQALFESGINNILARCEAEYVIFEKQTTITSNIMNAYFGQALATPDQYFVTVTDTDPSYWGLVINLANWGNETKFGYSDVLLKLVANNRYGDAVVASLKEGRANFNKKRKGAPVLGVKDSNAFRTELSNIKIDEIKQELQLAKQKLAEAIENNLDTLELRLRVDTLTEHYKTLRDVPGVEVNKKVFVGENGGPSSR